MVAAVMDHAEGMTHALAMPESTGIQPGKNKIALPEHAQSNRTQKNNFLLQLIRVKIILY